MSDLRIAVVTTFPDDAFDVYGRKMLESFVQYWPSEVPILVQTDTPKYAEEINKIIRSFDGLVSGWDKEHAIFVDRNKDKDDSSNYRKQAVRFCHKVFCLKHALKAVQDAVTSGATDTPRYLIWLDADVLTTRKVSFDDLTKCLPKEGDAVSYMGRKEWDHSECGWLAFDLFNSGDKIIEDMHQAYITNNVFALEQWHDSWVFDKTIKNYSYQATNLTPDAKGMEVWPQSPMGMWSRHYKGPIAKNELVGDVQETKKSGMQQLKIQTKNSLPDENLHKNIMENQTQIKNWVVPCMVHDEEAVVVSAGPTLIAEELYEDVKASKKIFAVKHALEALKKADIKPFGCILLDPRDHVYDFVTNPDKDIKWFVASQVTPKAVKSLLDAGCDVWGYHASVGAGETVYTGKQPHSIVDGGSATATRGLFLLDKLGFKKFKLYGYDLCFTKKPDLTEKDELGQPKYFEIEMKYEMPFHRDSRWFWSKGELLAQADEFRQILEMQKWDINAVGVGIAPFLAKIRKVNDLRKAAKLSKMPVSEPVYYEDMLRCRKKHLFSTLLHKMQQKIRLKPMKANNY